LCHTPNPILGLRRLKIMDFKMEQILKILLVKNLFTLGFGCKPNFRCMSKVLAKNWTKKQNSVYCDSCGALSMPAMSAREVTPGKRPHITNISLLSTFVYKADWHTQQWLICCDDIFILFLIPYTLILVCISVVTLLVIGWNQK